MWNRGHGQPLAVNQLIHDAVCRLQHRGQDAAGIATQMDRKFFMYKAKGMVRDVFLTHTCAAGTAAGPGALPRRRAMPTARKRRSPSHVNAPFGIVMVHNGNLTNARSLRELSSTIHRHTNTGRPPVSAQRAGVRVAGDQQRPHARSGRDVFDAARVLLTVA